MYLATLAVLVDDSQHQAYVKGRTKIWQMKSVRAWTSNSKMTVLSIVSWVLSPKLHFRGPSHQDGFSGMVPGIASFHHDSSSSYKSVSTALSLVMCNQNWSLGREIQIVTKYLTFNLWKPNTRTIASNCSVNFGIQSSACWRVADPAPVIFKENFEHSSKESWKSIYFPLKYEKTAGVSNYPKIFTKNYKNIYSCPAPGDVSSFGPKNPALSQELFDPLPKPLKTHSNCLSGFPIYFGLRWRNQWDLYTAYCPYPELVSTETEFHCFYPR